MRKAICLGVVLMVVAGVVVSGSHASNNLIKGQYVEVRTASVFAGACHYNGELTTTGRDALMAWKVDSGSWNGVDLAGVRALAIVSSTDNLSQPGKRRTELIVADDATYAQTVAMVNALKSRNADALGEIVAVKQARLNFLRHENAYSVTSAGIAVMEIEPMPDDLCCRMPQLVWYQPLVSLAQRKVGYTKLASYGGDGISEPWQRTGENSAFYGTFAL